MSKPHRGGPAGIVVPAKEAEIQFRSTERSCALIPCSTGKNSEKRLFRHLRTPDYIFQVIDSIRVQREIP
jgi:hypothetical protein